MNAKIDNIFYYLKMMSTLTVTLPGSSSKSTVTGRGRLLFTFSIFLNLPISINWGGKCLYSLKGSLKYKEKGGSKADWIFKLIPQTLKKKLGELIVVSILSMILSKTKMKCILQWIVLTLIQWWSMILNFSRISFLVWVVVNFKS